MATTRVPPIASRALVVLALCIAGPIVPAAQAAPCDTLPTPEITLAPVFATPAIDTSHDLAGLLALSRGGVSRHGEIGPLLGLTQVKPSGRFDDIAYDTVPAEARPGAGFCGVIKQIRLRLGFDEIVIHIAREVTDDRCLYDQVRQHEERHVQVDREVLAQYGPRIAINIRAQILAPGPMRGANPDAVGLEIQRRVEAALAVEFNAFMHEMRRRQQFVDRPAEYRRLSEACNGAARRLIEASRRAPAG
jgi:hypothetical protein